MEERKSIITMKGSPLTIVGHKLQLGEKAPDIELLDND